MCVLVCKKTCTARTDLDVLVRGNLFAGEGSVQNKVCNCFGVATHEGTLQPGRTQR